MVCTAMKAIFVRRQYIMIYLTTTRLSAIKLHDIIVHTLYVYIEINIIFP